MPELPEVESVRVGLLAEIIGKRIKSVIIYDAKLKQSLVSLVGDTFVDIIRKGKFLFFFSGKGKIILCHLRMTGQLVYKNIKGGHEGSSDKHVRAVIDFGAAKLAFNDQRRFGELRLITKAEYLEYIGRLGIDPLDKKFKLGGFNHRQKNIKAALLDQSLVSGIGNIYADEALYRAGVSPLRVAGSLSSVELRKLSQAIVFIIKKSLRYGGTTFRNYRNALGEQGNFVPFLKVYGRGGKLCTKCHGPIKKIKLLGRGTHYCPTCQK